MQYNIDAIKRIPMIDTLLEVICRNTGMGFAVIARVTDQQWIACAVRDEINFGLETGGELKLETTLCHEVKNYREAIVINNVTEDSVYACHHTPAMYGFQSYISVPITLRSGDFFGTLCAIDPKPANLDNPETIAMFRLYAELIGFQLSTGEQVQTMEQLLAEERKAAEEQLSLGEELVASNEELRCTNEKLIETREALEASINQLKLSQSRFQNLVREANIGIIVLIGAEMKVEIVNKTYGNLINRSVDQLLGRRLFDIIPEAEGSFLPIIDNVRVTGETLNLYDVPYWVYSEGKKLEGYLNLVYQPYIEDDRSITGVIILCQDVSEQVQAKDSLQSAYEQLRLSKEAAQLGFFDMNLTAGTMIWDARCRELFGISHTGTVTYEKDFVTGLHPEDKDRILAVIRNVFIKSVSNGVYDVEYRTVGAEDRQLRWVRAKGQAYFDESDKPVRFIGSVLDITEQKEDELRKNDFVSMVSHELKTPLTSLNSYVQVLQGRAQAREDEFDTGAFIKIRSQINKMTGLINGFLNISRLDSGKIHLNLQSFEINELLREVMDETSLIAQSHQMVLPPCPPVYLTADRDKISQVLSNLLSNAVKYSPKGKTIILRCQPQENAITISVKDEGMGIKPESVNKLFERFYRVENQHTQHIAGFGIGLYLCAEIVQRHNGKIWAESEIGKGSTFYFTLPVKSMLATPLAVKL